MRAAKEAVCEWMKTQTDSDEGGPMLELYGPDFQRKGPIIGNKKTLGVTVHFNIPGAQKVHRP